MFGMGIKMATNEQKPAAAELEDTVAFDKNYVLASDTAYLAEPLGGTVCKNDLSPDGNDLGGVAYRKDGLNITWRPATGAPLPTQIHGVTPAQVLAAVAMRLEAVQSTPQASDRNARALWEIHKALKNLEEPNE
jgi:hypothetical protein